MATDTTRAGSLFCARRQGQCLKVSLKPLRGLPVGSKRGSTRRWAIVRTTTLSWEEDDATKQSELENSA